MDIIQATMKEAATRFLDWAGKHYPNQMIEEGGIRIWRTAFLHEDFGNGKTGSQLYDEFIEYERKRIVQENKKQDESK